MALNELSPLVRSINQLALYEGSVKMKDSSKERETSRSNLSPVKGTIVDTKV